MRYLPTLGAAAAALCFALPAAAQTTDSTTAPSTTRSTTTTTTTSPMTGPTTSRSTTTTTTMGASDMPPAAGAASTAGAAAPASATAASPALMLGQPVKDNTGAVIGQITQLKPAAGGKQMATVQMGTDRFTVESTSFAVQQGAAVINATQAELKAMIHQASAAKPAG